MSRPIATVCTNESLNQKYTDQLNILFNYQESIGNTPTIESVSKHLIQEVSTNWVSLEEYRHLSNLPGTIGSIS